jgi:hypothetical protein
METSWPLQGGGGSISDGSFGGTKAGIAVAGEHACDFRL